MKRWIASAAALFLVVALAGPAIGAEQRGSDTGFAWSLDIHQLVNWLATLWYDHTPADTPKAPDGEQPRAFIEGTGPYIVPVGFASPDPDPGSLTETGGEAGDENG